MIYKLLPFLLLSCLSAEGVCQTKPDSFKIYENGEEIIIPDSVKAKLSTDSASTKNILLRWYAARGYLNAEIDSLLQQNISVTPGCEFRVSKLRITYEGETDSSFILENLGKYSQKDLERQIRNLIHDLEETGYSFSSSRIERFTPYYEQCTVSVNLKIETGLRVYSSAIYFSGAQTNNQDYLRKVSRFRDSVLVTPDYLRYLKSNLNSSELFNYIGDPVIYLREGKPVIIFDVEERSLNQFDGLLGYVPDASGEGQIVGNVELSLWNVLNQGNGVELRYQRLRPETSQLNLGLSQDWIGEIPIGASIGFQLYQNDTTYQTRDFDLDVFYRLSSGFKLTGGVGFQASTTGNDIPRVVEPDGRKRIARFGFEYSSLDNFDVPISGNRFKVNLSVANKDLDDDSLSAFIQRGLHFEAQNYISVFSKSVIATSLHGFLLDADKVTINDLVRFGGANSLRGYAEDQFRADKMLWADVEYRYLVNRNSFLFVFTAAGGYERPQLVTEPDDSFHTTDYLFSGGFGLSYRTRIGRLKFTYAVSPEESFGNGKVHFGIKTEL